nr:PREDICTED: dynein heavy chain 17, axonemal-like [Megachile rotundata]
MIILLSLQMLFDIAQDYLKLERIEIAGLKGKSLRSMVDEIYEEFKKLYDQFGELTEFVLIPEDPQFTEVLGTFLEKVN